MSTSPSLDYLALIRSGLPLSSSPRTKVVVIGAGMAGLTAAYELQRAGHEPIVLEARHRVGARVCTLREPFSDGLYAETGAMRIPRAHDLTMAYIDKFNVKVSPFTMGNPNAFYHLHGQRVRIGEANANPDALGFDVAAHERGKTAAQLWQDSLKPITSLLESQGSAAWPEIVAKYDQFRRRACLARACVDSGCHRVWVARRARNSSGGLSPGPEVHSAFGTYNVAIAFRRLPLRPVPRRSGRVPPVRGRPSARPQP